jgi:hypothetical protein
MYTVKMAWEREEWAFMVVAEVILEGEFELKNIY